MKTTSELIQQAHKQDVAERPITYKRADELEIGDVILPVQFRADSELEVYPGFYEDKFKETAYSDDYTEERMTITGIRLARESDGEVRLTLWAEMVWYGEPDEDNYGLFVYRRNYTAQPPKDALYEVQRT